MSCVELLDVKVLGNNPAPFDSPFVFDITYECITDLQSDLEWRLTYVGSPESNAHDQVREVLVGPVEQGKSRFTLEIDAPEIDKIPRDDVIGVTILLLTCSYNGEEFVRVGYYVNNYYDVPEWRDNPALAPAQIDFSHVFRHILTEAPRVTRFPIKWDGVPIDGAGAMPMGDGFQNGDLLVGERPQPADSAAPVDYASMLTVDIVRNIMRFLDIHEIGSCRRVSREWYSIVKAGLNLTAIELDPSLYDGYTDAAAQKSDAAALVQFAIEQSSPDSLQSIVAPFCPGLSDALLAQWLQRCGKALRRLDFGWCPDVSATSVNTILDCCPVLEDLRLACFGNQSGMFNEPDGNQLVARIVQRYKGTLTGLQLSDISLASLRLIAETLGQQLRYASFPYSENLNDDAAQQFAKTCTRLEHFGVEFCDVSCAVVRQLRKSIGTVRSSVTPEDVHVTILAAGEPPGLRFRLIGWREDLPANEIINGLEEDHLLPEGVKQIEEDNAEDESAAVDGQEPSEARFVFEGDPQQAQQLFRHAGFGLVTIDTTTEVEEDDDGEESISGESDVFDDDPSTQSAAQKIDDAALLADDAITDKASKKQKTA